MIPAIILIGFDVGVKSFQSLGLFLSLYLSHGISSGLLIVIVCSCANSEREFLRNAIYGAKSDTLSDLLLSNSGYYMSLLNAGMFGMLMYIIQVANLLVPVMWFLIIPIPQLFLLIIYGSGNNLCHHIQSVV